METESIRMPKEDGLCLFKPHAVHRKKTRNRPAWYTFGILSSILFSSAALILCCLMVIRQNKLTQEQERLSRELKELSQQCVVSAVEGDLAMVRNEISTNEEDGGSGQEDPSDLTFEEDENLGADTYGITEAMRRKRRAAAGTENSKRAKKGKKGKGRNGQNSQKTKKKNRKLTRQMKAEVQDMIDNEIEALSVPSLSPIHLEGNVSITPQEESSLCQSETSSMNRTWWHGKLYCQGFVPGNESLAFWKVADWVKEYPSSESDYTYIPDKGAVQVKHSGLYYIYAQVHFHETKGHLGYHVNATRGTYEEVKTLFTCITGVDYVAPLKNGLAQDAAKYKACSTSGLVQLARGDQVLLAMAAPNIRLETQPFSTFWGMIRIH